MGWLDMNKQEHNLVKDESFDGVDIRSGRINLNGRKLKIGSGGINIYSNTTIGSIVGVGSVTSGTNQLVFNFRNSTALERSYLIDSEIKNDDGYKVGLRISGGVPGRYNHLDFTGRVPNSFTGDVYISGYAGVGLARDNTSTVIGNIFLSENGYLNISGSHQINDNSSIILNGSSGMPLLAFSSYSHYTRDTVEKIHSLIIEGNGVIDFYAYPWEEHGTRHFYLDDIDVTFGAELLIRSWALGRDHILVRKDSAHLQESLSRIKFGGRSEPKASVRDYNNDYWQIIPGFPEPTAYGAILSAAILGLAFYRTKKAQRYFGCAC